LFLVENPQWARLVGARKDFSNVHQDYEQIFAPTVDMRLLRPDEPMPYPVVDPAPGFSRTVSNFATSDWLTTAFFAIPGAALGYATGMCQHCEL
jgi:hypothetical protein